MGSILLKKAAFLIFVVFTHNSFGLCDTEAFEERLKNRPMKEELNHIKEGKEKLAEKLMEVAKENKTPPWNKKDLNKVLNQLKKDKSRDPH